MTTQPKPPGDPKLITSEPVIIQCQSSATRTAASMVGIMCSSCSLVSACWYSCRRIDVYKAVSAQIHTDICQLHPI
jgi:hypothetical protein